MKKNNGFTLIELLAVIVILAIIALIAVPIIAGVIETAKKGSKESSGLGYVDAVGKAVAISTFDKSKPTIQDGVYTVRELKSDYVVSVKGETPTDESWVTIENKEVVACSLKIDEYVVNCIDKTVKVVNQTEVDPKPLSKSSDFNIEIVSGPHGTITSDVSSVKYGNKANVTITPDEGYYLESLTCSNGWQIEGATIGEEGLGEQNITISNNNNLSHTVCEASFRSKIVVTDHCIYWKNQQNAGTRFDFSDTGDTLTINTRLWWESISTVGYAVIYVYDGDGKLLGGKQTRMAYGTNYGVNNTDTFELDLTKSRKDALKSCYFTPSLSTGTATNIWGRNQATSAEYGIQFWVSFTYYK